LYFDFQSRPSFFAVALSFFYGSRLVSTLEYSNIQFFVGLMVRVCLWNCIPFGDILPPQSSIFCSIQAGDIVSRAPDISSAKGAGFDALKLIDSRPKINAETKGKEVSSKEVRGQIRLENIHFHYPTRPGVRVLRGLSLKVEPGTYIALIGASGSGKSTV
jgi:ATP-binding cassette subfamily B (MDR/TAP) protein 1